MIQRWFALLSKTDSLEKSPINRIVPRSDSEKLNTYIEINPDVLPKEIAEHFNGQYAHLN